MTSAVPWWWRHRSTAWLRLSACALLWPLAFVAWLVLLVLGAQVVPPLALLGAVERRPSRLFRDREVDVQAWSPWWAFPWSNDEDGVSGPTTSSSWSTRRWIVRALDWPAWRRRISWSVVRNSVGNERLLPLLGLYLDPARQEWLGNCGNPHRAWLALRATPELMPRRLWVWSRQGLRSGVWLLWPNLELDSYSELRLGWKVYPGPRREIDRFVGTSWQYHRARRAIDPD